MGKVGLAKSTLVFIDAAAPVPCSCDGLTIGYNAMIGSPPPDANSSLYGWNARQLTGPTRCAKKGAVARITPCISPRGLHSFKTCTLHGDTGMNACQ